MSDTKENSGYRFSPETKQALRERMVKLKLRSVQQMLDAIVGAYLREPSVPKPEQNAISLVRPEVSSDILAALSLEDASVCRALANLLRRGGERAEQVRTMLKLALDLADYESGKAQSENGRTSEPPPRRSSKKR